MAMFDMVIYLFFFFPLERKKMLLSILVSLVTSWCEGNLSEMSDIKSTPKLGDKG